MTIDFTDDSGGLFSVQDEGQGFGLLLENGSSLLLENAVVSRLLLEIDNLKSFTEDSGGALSFTEDSGSFKDFTD